MAKSGRIQRSLDGKLELQGIELAPTQGGPFDISPEIGRVVANLAGVDKGVTRLLKAVPSGALLTVPFVGVVKPDGYAIVDIGVPSYPDMGSARPRMIRVIPFKITLAESAGLYECTVAGCTIRAIGFVTHTTPMIFYVESQYLKWSSAAAEAVARIEWWNL